MLQMAAEFFDDKLLSFGYTTFGVYETRNLTYDEFVYYELMVNLAQFDATIAIWKEKARWDAVRPFTAIPYLYGDQKITAYCGKGKCRFETILSLKNGNVLRPRPNRISRTRRTREFIIMPHFAPW